MTLRRSATIWLAVTAAAALQACTPAPAGADDAFGLQPLVLPAGMVRDPAHVELGRKLFFDRRLSFNGVMSCAMCHVPEVGFTSNASKTAVGIEGRSLRRNTPTLLNVAWHLRHMRPCLYCERRYSICLWQP